MKLTFWYARCEDDGDCYSIRERTKKEALRVKARSHGNYGEVEKVVLEYSDGFDLMDGVAGESGVHTLRVN